MIHMKKYIKIGVLVLVVLFIAAQFIRPDLTNPPIDAAQTLAAVDPPPGDIDLILSRSCNDCHTNHTQYPWYSKITPSNWFLANHIKDGRRHLNFSEWGTYSPKKRAKKYEEICEMVTSREMPLPSYLWLHGESAMSDADIKTVCDWTNAEAAKQTIEATEGGSR